VPLVRRLILVTALVFWFAPHPSAQLRLADESDRAAFRSWFVLLADAQFERPTSDVTDCAALVRHAFREALRAHTPEWVRGAALPFTPQFADVRSAPRAGPDGWPLFRIVSAKLGVVAILIAIGFTLLVRESVPPAPED
jgi:hypothetical protein